MAFPAAAIANEFLDLAHHDDTPLTQMQLQKLVFFAHGWNLALTDEPLINERIVAEEYGPVVRSLWNALREFGSEPITKKARVPDWESDLVRWVTPSIDDGPNSAENDYAKALVQRIWTQYGKLKAFELSELTHMKGTPWAVARDSSQDFVGDSDIATYFKQQLQPEPVPA
jgi:uncharacterized phage-associated protein